MKDFTEVPQSQKTDYPSTADDQVIEALEKFIDSPQHTDDKKRERFQQSVLQASKHPQFRRDFFDRAAIRTEYKQYQSTNESTPPDLDQAFLEGMYNGQNETDERAGFAHLVQALEDVIDPAQTGFNIAQSYAEARITGYLTARKVVHENPEYVPVFMTEHPIKLLTRLNMAAILEYPAFQSSSHAEKSKMLFSKAPELPRR